MIMALAVSVGACGDDPSAGASDDAALPDQGEFDVGDPDAVDGALADTADVRRSDSDEDDIGASAGDKRNDQPYGLGRPGLRPGG